MPTARNWPSSIGHESPSAGARTWPGSPRRTSGSIRRFWYDGRPQVINGFVIRRRGDQWSAFRIRQTNEGEPVQVREETLPMPKSGWEAAWQKLVNAGILTLPDGWSNKRCHSGVLDGGGYVIETNVNKVYRTYMYANPQLANCDEAKEALLIEKIISEEFRLA